MAIESAQCLGRVEEWCFGAASSCFGPNDGGERFDGGSTAAQGLGYSGRVGVRLTT